MEELNHKINCNTCGEEKERIFDGWKYYGTKAKLWVAECGRRWNGKRCPDCQTKHVLNRRKRKPKPKDKEAFQSWLNSSSP